MSLTAAERETIITLNDEDDDADIYTEQRPWITKLKKNPSATLIEEGKHDGSVWARFRVPKQLISIRAQSRKGQGAGRGKGQLPPGLARSKTRDVALVSDAPAPE